MWQAWLVTLVQKNTLKTLPSASGLHRWLVSSLPSDVADVLPALRAKRWDNRLAWLAYGIFGPLSLPIFGHSPTILIIRPWNLARANLNGPECAFPQGTLPFLICFTCPHPIVFYVKHWSMFYLCYVKGPVVFSLVPIRTTSFPKEEHVDEVAGRGSELLFFFCPQGHLRLLC